ncbi:MAG: 16S rRNA (adenine(1518)-N(6)/adenine(1519)-N(6))-dimethyltransferase RsmA [Planctomycetota bacterium]
MQTLNEIRAHLARHNLAPKKSLGQNFLIDQNLLNKLVDASGVQHDDLVLEVGPGTGTLTETLLERGCRVVAVELDTGLAGLLRDTIGERVPERFTLIEGDCLERKTRINEKAAALLGDQPFRLVANLPYQAASPLLITLAVDHPNCLGMFVTVQKEVGQRLRAQPGTKQFGELAILTQAVFEVSRIADLPGSCFWPPPKVESQIVAMRRLDSPRVADIAATRALCDLLFAHRRKQIGKTLGRDAELPVGIDPSARPEQLSIEQFGDLAAWHASRDPR